MKLLTVLFILCASMVSQAASSCGQESQVRVGINAVKALVNLTNANEPAVYYGGATLNNGKDGKTELNIAPHFISTKSWYIVSVRNSDCMVLSVLLRADNIPIDSDIFKP